MNMHIEDKMTMPKDLSHIIINKISLISTVYLYIYMYIHIL